MEPDEPEMDDDVELIDSPEAMLEANPLVRLFGDGARVKLLAVLLQADHPMNVTRICELADVNRSTWYDHEDELLESGLVYEAEPAGNSPMFAFVDAEDDRRTEWLEKLHDWSGAYFRDGSRPDGGE